LDGSGARPGSKFSIMKRHRASLCCDLDTVWTTLVLLSTYFRVSPGGIGCGEGDADAVRISRPSVCFARSLVACVLSLSSTHAPRAPRPAQQPCVIGLESQRDGLPRGGAIPRPAVLPLLVSVLSTCKFSDFVSGGVWRGASAGSAVVVPCSPDVDQPLRHESSRREDRGRRLGRRRCDRLEVIRLSRPHVCQSGQSCLLAGGRRRQGARLLRRNQSEPVSSIDDTSTLVWPCMLVLLLPGSAANGFHAGLR
jgi:hypothetical protein